MVLTTLDWSIIVAFFVFSLLIGIYAARFAGKSVTEFFLSGRSMPWWLLGVSMVATTFSTDTPNLVTDIVRQNGVAGNWVWWAFLLTGMLTVFVFAKLWRRSGVLTDLEFYELRYSGKMASFLRGFRAIYLGAFFNIMVIAMVSLALIKIGAVMLNWPPVKTLLIASVITVVYSTLGGLRGIVLTDFFQFILAMIGSVGAAIILIKLPEIGGLKGLLSHETVQTRMRLLPDWGNPEELWSLLLLPLLIQWWSVWYPGSEPGGGGYIAQRMLSAKTEQGAAGATLFFNVAHYALRPWPWILVAMASLIIFPDIDALKAAFPHVNPEIIRHDFAYPAMLTLLPKGFTGLVVASLLAAFMSTASTQLNWGASYLVHDFYHRFVKPQASDRELVFAGRAVTVVLMIFSGLLALLLENALQAFQILLQVGAGTGLIYILRWFYWRINAYSELTAMIVSFFVACYFEFVHAAIGLPELSAGLELIVGVAVTTASWLLVTFITRPTDKNVLKSFYEKIRPVGPGWKPVETSADNRRTHLLGLGILCMGLGCTAVYGALFATGQWIYGHQTPALILTLISGASVYGLMKTWTRLNED